jgi:4-hydroxybenzoate polyprenyltransferase
MPNQTIERCLRIARFDHWVKNIFSLPGVALAAAIGPGFSGHLAWSLPIALLSLGFVASANYAINEWLDADFDRHHPRKKDRSMVADRLSAGTLVIWYLVLAGIGLGLAATINPSLVLWSIALLVMGIAYNVPPLRTKDLPYLDVLSESINNPLRFLLGWSLILPATFPPSSVLVAYWMGGAYLMAIKRYAEFRMIDDPQRAGLYRRSFKAYTETSLLVSALFYAMMSALMLGVFLIKYRVEYLLSFPLFAILFAWYLALSHEHDSAAQAPEKLFRERAFVAYVAFLAGMLWLLWEIDIPSLKGLVDPLSFPGAR